MQKTIGWLEIVFYLVHAGYHLLHHEPYHLLWTCHLGCFLVGIGLVTGRAYPFAVGFLWLMLGIPLWVLNLLTGADLIATSTLTHVGGMIVAVVGFASLPMPRYAWAAATAGLIALVQLSRWATPAHANVNIAFKVWEGWETTFPSYFRYSLMLLAMAVGVFVCGNWVGRMLAGYWNRLPKKEKADRNPS